MDISWFGEWTVSQIAEIRPMPGKIQILHSDETHLVCMYISWLAFNL